MTKPHDDREKGNFILLSGNYLSIWHFYFRKISHYTDRDERFPFKIFAFNKVDWNIFCNGKKIVTNFII